MSVLLLELAVFILIWEIEFEFGTKFVCLRCESRLLTSEQQTTGCSKAASNMGAIV